MGIDITGLQVHPVLGHIRMVDTPGQINSANAFSARSGAITGVAAGGAMFSMRNKSAKILVLRKLSVSFVTTTAFTVGQEIAVGLRLARGFTVTDATGTGLVTTGTAGKLRSNHSPLAGLDLRMATTAGLTGSTRTLEAGHIGIAQGFSATAGLGLTIPKEAVWSVETGDYPLVLQTDEGLIFENLVAMGVGGAGVLCVSGEYFEVDSF